MLWGQFCWSEVVEGRRKGKRESFEDFGYSCHFYNQTCQGDVTPIQSVLPPATGVKNFDPQFFLLTFDFAIIISLTVDF